MKILFSLFFIFLFSLISQAQLTDIEVKEFITTASEEELLTENTRMMASNYLFQAELVMDKLLLFKQDNSNYNYRKGYLLMEGRRDYANAIPYLLKAIKNTKPHFDAFNTKEESAPADAFYHLATCYHYKYDFDEAIKHYNSFLTASFSKSSLIEIAKIKIAQCELGKKLIEKPVKVKLLNMGKEINNSFPDYSPVISLDGSALYFTSRRPWEGNQTEMFRDPAINQYPEDVYVSYMDYDSSWTTATRLDFCLPERNEATIGVSPGERRIYLYEDSTGSGDIYYTDFYAQKFNDIKKLEIENVNTKYWETHCFFTNDGSKAFFSSDRLGGLGGRDLYMCLKTSDSTWSEPRNLGSKINSVLDEDAPFVSVDNKTLYYSSNGEKSIGGFDILISDLDVDGNYSDSRNVGYPFNSTNDDIYYTTTIDGLRGYMASYRENGQGEKDIYEISNDFLGVKSIAVLKGLIRMRDFSPLPEDFAVSMTIKCLNCEDSKSLRTLFPRVTDGYFFTDLQPCKSYELSFMKAGDTLNMYKNQFSTACTQNYQEIYKEVILDVESEKVYPVIKYAIDGIIADVKTNLVIPNSKIEVIDLYTNSILETIYTDTNGAFKLISIKNNYFGDTIKYELKVSAENYLTQSFTVNEILGNKENFHLNYLLDKPVIGTDIATIFDIQPIYFDFDKSAIRADAKIELDKIVKILNENPMLKIEYGSHTDCRGSFNYNMRLSQLRATASANYIKSRISNPSRIKGKGYGESKLINNCECEGAVNSTCTEIEHQANRRTEFIIVK